MLTPNYGTAVASGSLDTNKYTTMKNTPKKNRAAIAQEHLVRPLEVGCVVTTNSGQRHTIAEIGFGGSEAVAENSFYHWDKNWPYEIEHAAMDPDQDVVVSVSWPNAERIHDGAGLPNQSETPTPLGGASC